MLTHTTSHETHRPLTNQSLESLADQLSPEQGRERYHRIISLSSRVRARLSTLKSFQAEFITEQPKSTSSNHGPPLPAKDQHVLKETTESHRSPADERPHHAAMTTTRNTLFRRNKPLPEPAPLIVQPVRPQIMPLTPVTTVCSPQSPSISVNDPLNDPAFPHTNVFGGLRNDSAIGLCIEQKQLPNLPPPIGTDPSVNQIQKSSTLAALQYKDKTSPPATSHRPQNGPPSSDDDPVCFLLLTPPDSPQQHQQYHESEDNEDSFIAFGDVNRFAETHVTIKHIQKRINGFIGLLTRTYQLHDIVLSRTLVSSTGLYNATDSVLDKSKAVLKLVISKNPRHMDDQQRHFGFTFFWRGHSNFKPHRASDVAKFALVSDDLVKSALTCWIGQHTFLPPLARATHILRESLKLYIVYDRHLVARR